MRPAGGPCVNRHNQPATAGGVHGAETPGRMKAVGRLDPRAVDAALRRLLEGYPSAFVTAINEDGLFVRMPASIPVNGQRMLQARTALDLVVPADREAVISAWERARSSGGANAQVHLRLDPDRAAVTHYLDVRANHGVFVGVVVGSDAAALAALPDVRPAPPRVARARKNDVAVFLDVDEATTRILGWGAADMIGRRSLEFIHPEDQDRAIESWTQMLSEPGVEQPPARLRHRRVDGSWTWFEVTNRNLLGDREAGYVLAEMVDVSDEMAAHEAVRAREQLLHRLAEALPIGVLQALPDRRIEYANDRLRGILGIEAAATLDAQLATVAPHDRAPLDAALTAALEDGIDGDLEVQIRTSDPAHARRCMVRLRALADDAGRTAGAVICVEDVTESARMRAELERRATHDLLTRVMNRASVMAALEGALVAGATRGTAVIFVDLDRFKLVNDRLGHLAGDELLRVVADRLAITVRAGDVLGRVGGDEFLIVCPNVTGREPALRVGERIARAVNQPVRLEGGTIELRASIGVAWSGRRRIGADTLVRRADAAMYASKRDGAGQPVFYTRDLRTHHSA